MSPGILQRYRAMLAAGELNEDTGQRLAVEKLQILHNRLLDYQPTAPSKVRTGLFGWGREKMEQREVPGLYLYGGVGRGKSMLMDMFYEASTVEPRQRVHFHAFMRDVHAGIHKARKAGIEDPIRPVADEIADRATLLCFDEMQVTDITDAMIVGRLFERLFARGVVVVATSNRHPDDLYKDGLNRHLFLPFIAQIKERLDIHELDGGPDHRRAFLYGEDVYHAPLDEDARARMDDTWARLAGGQGAPLTLTRLGREVTIPCFLNGVGRGSFEDFCGAAFGPGDYLAMVEAVRVLMIDDIPRLSRAQNNEAKRFVTLIDAVYEARVRLIASAAAEPDALYAAGAGAFEFERTASRLEEMRGAEWAEETPL